MLMQTRLHCTDFKILSQSIRLKTKKMKNLNSIIWTMLFFVLILTSCQKEEDIINPKERYMPETMADIQPKISQRNCRSHEYLQRQIQADPGRKQRLEAIDQLMQASQFAKMEEGTTYTIPVVVHVVYKTAAQNISNAQIQSQINVINDDFRRMNSDANNTWSQAADTEIEFCLATQDPNGNPTSGITRTSTTKTSFTDDDKVKKSNQGGKNPWDTQKYLNIWVCNIGGFLGYAQFPGGPAATDGVVVDDNYFGTVGTATAPFDKGRTLTHEIGHYLNLYHIWGDGACGQDDNVADTPNSDAANYGCASNHTSCSSTDMVQNYMDYSDDACMNWWNNRNRWNYHRNMC